ncbi:MAG: HAD family phosphatase [Pirellulaceae bacterium]|nr:HAD family phosphatase [Pirellulaceae bacterium]
MTFTDDQHSLRWPHKIKAVAFDMDGLMVNTEELYYEVGQTILSRRGRQFTDALRRGMMGLPGPKAFELMIATENLSDSVATLTSECDEVFSSMLPHRLRPLKGLLELLESLDEQQTPRCVATSSTLRFAREVLEGISVLNRVDFIITAEHVANGKPHPDIYLGAAIKLGVQPHELLVFEDSQHGSRAGMAAGACTVAIPGDHSRHHDFSGVHFIAESLADPRIYELFTKSQP